MEKFKPYYVLLNEYPGSVSVNSKVFMETPEIGVYQLGETVINFHCTELVEPYWFYIEYEEMEKETPIFRLTTLRPLKQKISQLWHAKRKEIENQRFISKNKKSPQPIESSETSEKPSTSWTPWNEVQAQMEMQKMMEKDMRERFRIHPPGPITQKRRI